MGGQEWVGFCSGSLGFVWFAVCHCSVGNAVVCISREARLWWVSLLWPGLVCRVGLL